MKMQLVTIRPQKSGIDAGFKITRELLDDCGLVDMAFCSVSVCKNGFAASGFTSIYKPSIMHEASDAAESIDDFVKAVFSRR